ncbi:hypothetical protein BH11PLA2_BH11PLA2_27440 [soil metagenome]
MKRLIAGLFLLAITTTLTAADKTSGAEKLGWKLALQSWTGNYMLKDGKKVKLSLFESIDVANKLGLKFIEVYPGQELSPTDKAKFGPGMTEEQMKTTLAKAKDAGLTIIDCGVIGIPAKEDEARKLFTWAKKMGITTIVSEPDPTALKMIDKVAGEFDIKVAIHDHPKPSKYWDPEYTNGLCRELKNVGLCADVGHWKRSGLEPTQVLNTYGEKVFSSHFKDLVPNGKNMKDVVWGTGESKAADMLKALKAKNFKGPIAIEFETEWELSTLQKCVDFFHAEANKLAAE